MTENGPRSLHRKLAEVMAEVGRVPKRGLNKFHGYAFATESDIADMVRQELARRGVVLIPEATGYERETVQRDSGKATAITLVRMRFTFVDGETGETDSREWFGLGEDPADKGLYKAYTGALKYFLLKTFLMPTGDDPESDEATDARAAGSKSKRSEVRGATQTTGGAASAALPPPKARENDAASGVQNRNANDVRATGGPAEPITSKGTAQAATRAPHANRARAHAYLADVGFRNDEKDKPERRRLYSLALGRAIVTDEDSSKITEEEWGGPVMAYLRQKYEPPMEPQA